LETNAITPQKSFSLKEPLKPFCALIQKIKNFVLKILQNIKEFFNNLYYELFYKKTFKKRIQELEEKKVSVELKLTSNAPFSINVNEISSDCHEIYNCACKNIANHDSYENDFNRYMNNNKTNPNILLNKSMSPREAILSILTNEKIKYLIIGENHAEKASKIFIEIYKEELSKACDLRFQKERKKIIAKLDEFGIRTFGIENDYVANHPFTVSSNSTNKKRILEVDVGAVYMAHKTMKQYKKNSRNKNSKGKMIFWVGMNHTNGIAKMLGRNNCAIIGVKDHKNPDIKNITATIQGKCFRKRTDLLLEIPNQKFYS
jgi:hypothetical protein